MIALSRKLNFGNRKSSSGFTLVELLVVIAIILLLVALILPLFTSARIAAKTAVCISNMRQIGFAFQTYVTEHRGFLPSNHFGPNPTWYCEAQRNIVLTPQTGTVFPYLNEYRVYVCPLDGPTGNGRLSYSSPTVLRNKPAGHMSDPPNAIVLVHEMAEQFIANGHEEGGFANIDRGSEVHGGKVTLLYGDWHGETWWQDHAFYAKDIKIDPWGWNE